MSTAEAPSVDQWLAWRPEEMPRVRTLLAMRGHWMNQLYGRLRREWVARDSRANDPVAIRADVEALPGHPWFIYMDRYIQEQLWDEVDRMAESRMQDAARVLDPRPGDLGALELKGDCAYPGYYEFDFHRQGGGIWRDDRGAIVYAMGARVIHVGKNDKFELHDKFADAIPDNRPRRILDLGCGFGKTTFSLARRFPNAETVGIDLAAPCLRLGRRMATERGQSIVWRQGDCGALDETDASADLVTITMVLHELPREAIEDTFAEAFRVLRPGGLLVTLENRYVGETLRDVLIADHSETIAEPYSFVFRNMDMAEVARDAGFAEAKTENWYPFGGDDEQARHPERWTTPWTLMTARKGP